MTLEQITDDLVEDLEGLSFGPPVTHVYNPNIYARAPWDAYCDQYGRRTREILLLGMNPGPFGMAQTGVPFGEIGFVRDWLGIEAGVGKPPVEHPKRPVDGFACSRREVSGSRLWGWAQARFGTPERFFQRFFVFSYCPLVFMEESGRNRVPEKLPRAERVPLFEACDRALRRSIEHFEPELILGIGKFGETCARRVAGGLPIKIGRMAHPSPASPLANKGWDRLADAALAEHGVTVEAL